MSRRADRSDAQAVLHDTRLDHLPDGTRRALHENWISVHAVSRAAWELGLLETVRSIDASYREVRTEATTLKEYEKTVAAVVQPVPSPDAIASARSPSVEQTQPPHPFMAAVTQWPVSIEQAVKTTLDKHPSVTTLLEVAQRHASVIWREPEIALSRVQAALPSHFQERRIVLDEMARNPQQYGELNGGRSLLMRPDVTRQKALETAILFSCSINDVKEKVDLLRPSVLAAETQWRDLMARPMPTLSVEATKVVEALVLANGMKRPDREPAHEIALKAISNRQVLAEVTAWRKELDQRLAVPDAVNRIPEISTQKASEIQTTAATVDVALKEAKNTQRIEIERERSITIKISPDIDISI